VAVKKPPPSRAAAAIRKFYFRIWYTRSPASVLVDSILRPCFLAVVERKPRIECFCQSVAFTISASVAPLGRPISSRIFAPLLSARGVLASLVWAGLAAFLLALASFFGEAAGALPLALLWPLGAPFFWVAPFFGEVSFGATCAPCSATVAAFSVIIASAFVIVLDPFCAVAVRGLD
jgi:hypothetical protein